MFNKFKSRLVVEGVLLCNTAVHLGAGKKNDPILPDMPVMRDTSGSPYIPGSSMKGVFRAFSESILRTAGGKILACNPLESGERCISDKQLQELKRQFDGNPQSLAKEIVNLSCLACKIFGSSAISSKVKFEDMPVMRNTWFGQFELRNGVAIDRDTGTAKRGALYDFEVVPAGSRFKFKVTADNATDVELGLIEFGLRAMESGILEIGGNKSRGLGAITLKTSSYQYYDSIESILNNLMAKSELSSNVSAELKEKWLNAIQSQLMEAVNA